MERGREKTKTDQLFKDIIDKRSPICYINEWVRKPHEFVRWMQPVPLFLPQLDKTDLAAAMVGSFTTSSMQYLVTVSMHTSPVLEHSKRCSLTFVSVACHVVSTTYLCAVKSTTIFWLTFFIVGVLSSLCLLILVCAFSDSTWDVARWCLYGCISRQSWRRFVCDILRV